MKKFKLKKAFVFLGLGLLSSPSHAFTLIAQSVTAGWNTKELTFLVNEASCTSLGISAATLNAAIDSAVDLWNSADSSGLSLKKGGTTTLTADNDPPVIYCSTAITSPDFVAGQGSIGGTLNGHPATGSLKLNGDNTKLAYFNNLSSIQQQVVVSHEIGHVLGLGHSEKQYALMYYDISSKASLNLSQDDIDGISWLNPRSEPNNGFMGCGTISDISKNLPPPGNHSVLFTWIALLLLAYGVTRPRARSAQIEG